MFTIAFAPIIFGTVLLIFVLYYIMALVTMCSTISANTLDETSVAVFEFISIQVWIYETLHITEKIVIMF